MRKNFFSSIFTKILLITIFLALLINLILSGAFHLIAEMNSHRVQSSIMQYGRYMIADLGMPPDREKAAELAQSTGAYIEYYSENLNWTEGEYARVPCEKELKKITGGDGLEIYHDHRHTSIKYAENGQTLRFVFAPDRNMSVFKKHVSYLTLGLIILLLMGAHFLIRRLIKPIKKMYVAMEEVKNGNYDYKIEQRGRGELAQLCSMFNSLTSEISSAVKLRERLLMDVGHDLRTPITSIRLAAEMIEDPEIQEDIREDVHYMDELISTILDSTRLQCIKDFKPDIAAFDLYELTRDLCGKLPGGDVVVISPAESLYISGDRKLIFLVMKNLIENALKYSAGSGMPVNVDLASSGGKTEITVSDKGIGISEEDLPFVTEPFYRAENSRTRATGYGLGLNLCSRIADLLDGELKIESRQGQGTRVFFRF